jgi:hypothetical protein
MAAEGVVDTDAAEEEMAAEAVAATHAAEIAAVLPSREAIMTVAVPRAHRDAAATMTAKVLAGTPEAAIGRATGKVVGSTITARISAALVLTSSSMAAVTATTTAAGCGAKRSSPAAPIGGGVTKTASTTTKHFD